MYYSLKAQICLHTEDGYIFDTPGILSGVFAELRGTDTNQAYSEYNTYNKRTLLISQSNSFDDVIRIFADQVGFIYNLDEYYQFVKPALMTDKNIYYVDDRTLDYQFAQEELYPEKIIKVLLVFNGNAGEVFRGEYPGFTFTFHSREDKRHRPHIHVDFRHEKSGSFLIPSGDMMKGNMILGHQKKIKDIIQYRAEELLEYWKHHVNGLSVDLNSSLQK